MPITLNGDTGITTPSYGGTDTSEYLVPVTAFKNRIINGAMGIWQRGTSFTNTANSSQYTADRWTVFGGVGLPVVTTQVSSGLQDFPNALRVQRPNGNTATTNTAAIQVIETSNCRDLEGQSITVSFLARAGANYSQSGNGLVVFIGTGTGTDQGSVSWINGAWTGLANTSQTITLTTTMTRYSLTYSIPSGTNEIVLAFLTNPTGTAGAADYFDITGVQLEKGSTATSFDYRPYGTELALAQRYYQIDDTPLESMLTAAGNFPSIYAWFKTTMRAAPTVTSVTGVRSVGTPTVNITVNAIRWICFNSIGDRASIASWTASAEL